MHDFLKTINARSTYELLLKMYKCAAPIMNYYLYINILVLFVFMTFAGL